MDLSGSSSDEASATYVFLIIFEFAFFEVFALGRSKNIGKTAVDEILRMRKSRDLLSAREESLLNIINDPHSADYLVIDSENKYHATVAAVAQLTEELSQRERALGVEDKQQLRHLSNNPYIRDRMNALALKTRLRDKLRSRKFELDRLERTLRKQVNGLCLF